MVEQEEFTENYSDDDVDLGTHNKLLSAVTRLYKKQRVDKPKRSEPYVNVSEYHLSNYESADSKKDQVKVIDLVKVLNRKTSHQQIKSKFESVKGRSPKLPKPLEKIHADKIKRSVGYEHLKYKVSRWNGLVNQNRSAPQLTFPLKDDSEIKVYKPLEFLHTFKEPTELEKNMAEVLQQSSVAQQESQVEEAIFNLSIPEMIEKRKLVAKLKAKESFKIVKAMKQNKIKSKKYRRVMRKEKLKQELKDFETLQRTDPEAALEKLNKLEKERAEERASLRHRNTGKWARGQAIRAKYDKDARIQLAEQISKSRELTRKRKIAGESSSEEELEEEEEEEPEKSPNDKQQDDNPWTQEREQTVEEFVAGYQSYWKNKKNQPQAKPPVINKAALARLVGKDTKKSNLNNDKNLSDHKNISTETTPTESNNISISEETLLNDSYSEKEIDSFKNSIAKLNSSITATEQSSTESEDEISDKRDNKDSVFKINSSSPSKKLSNVKNVNSFNKSSKCEITPSKSKASKGNNQKSSCVSITVKETESTPLSLSNKKKRKSKDKACIKNISGSWDVTPEKSNAKPGRKNRALDDIFDKMEGDLQERVKERLKKFEEVASEDKNEESDITISEKKRKSNSDNKNAKEKHDASIITETTEKEHEESNEELEDLLSVINDKESKEEKEKTARDSAIDPNKFLNMTPRILSAQIPDLVNEGDDVVDDPDDNRRVQISEAFAEDDVVEEFRKEKEDEVKSSENQDVDLFLPGWGSWGGPSIDPSKTKRKRKRFFVKAPENKRKDSKKPNVIINEDLSDKYKTHLVSDLPFPFTSVRAYEASIRAPIGSTFVPELAVTKLVKPPVIKKLGAVIEPMSEAQFAKNNKRKSSLKVNNFNQTDGTNIK